MGFPKFSHQNIFFVHFVAINQLIKDWKKNLRIAKALMGYGNIQSFKAII